MAFAMKRGMSAVFPTRSLALLMGIGLIDLIATATLHAHGLITEMNPFMRFFIERSEWSFAIAKGLTLAVSWAVMASYARKNKDFVQKACLAGSLAYVALWATWFTIGS
jgi:hypothetical protein